MLIIPLTGKISRKNPPAITIGIILINCFVFFILQAGDGDRYGQAIGFYMESGLAKIEISRYLDYLETVKGQDLGAMSQRAEDLDHVTIMRFYQKMQTDQSFIKKLVNDEIITPKEDIYPKWKSLRIKYDGMLSTLVSFRYGFKPAHKNILTAFTYMFLHGSFMHILGNMVFLWLVGCVLELGCGRLLYMGMYLLSGMLSAALFCLVYTDSTVPLIGASGAISGLIGAYTVTYGRRKIKVFYSLGIYFNYAKVSAIILLPIWIGKEVFQLLFGEYSEVAYVAHIGGLISGALVAYVNLKILGRIDEEIFAEDPKEKIAPLLEQALKRIGELDMEGARPLLAEVLEIDPNNRGALTHLFNIDKLNPEGDRFHKTATRLLGHLISDKEAHGTMYNTYKEYTRISQRPQFNSDFLFRVSSIFSARGYLEESEKIMVMLLKKQPRSQKIPNGILNLARAYLKTGMAEKGKKCLQIICKRYPESAEYQVAQRLLKNSK